MARAFIITVQVGDGAESEVTRYGDASMTDEELEEFRERAVEQARLLTKRVGYYVRIYSPGDDDEPPTIRDLFWDSTVNK